MTMFWFTAALLLTGALLMLLPPLLGRRSNFSGAEADAVVASVYRDQLRETERDLEAGLIAPADFAGARADIQRRLLEESGRQGGRHDRQRPWRTALLLGLTIPLGSVLVYLALGDTQSLRAELAQDRPAAAGERHNVSREQIETMVANLAQRLKSQPGDAAGWGMLARSYTALGRYQDAVIAFRRASQLEPRDAGLLADFADVLGMAQGKRLAGEPARLVQQALDIDPNHVKALALAGSVSFEARDYGAARGYWERVVPLVPADSDAARSIRGSIAQAVKLDSAPAPAPASVGAAPATPGAAASLQGEVTVAQALAGRIGKGDTLFIYARAAQGPRMPLAIIKRPVDAWPSPFVLDDTMAMAPNLKLSGFDQVVVTARISRRGDAAPASGDLIGHSAPVRPGTRDLRISIEQVQQ